MTKLARLAAVISALYMAFALVWNGARYPTMGLDHTLYGDSDRPAQLVGKPYPADKMREWASTYGVDVVVEGSPTRPQVVAGYPAGPRSELARWISEEYPCVRDPCRTRALSLVDDPGLVDRYEIGVAGLSFMGPRSAEAAAAAQQYFAGRGWRTGVQELDSASYWAEQLRLLFGRLVVVVAVLVGLLTGGHVLTRGRAVGVQLLLGSARSQLLAADTLGWTAGTALATGVGVGVAALGVQVLFHGHALGRVLAVYLPVCALLWLAGLTGLAVSHQLLRATSILESIKGRFRFGLALPVMYLLRSLVVVMCATSLLGLASTAARIRAYEQVLAHPGPLAGYSTFGVNTGATDNPALQRRAAGEVAPLYRDGRLLLAQAKERFFYNSDPSVSVELRPGDAGLVLEVSPPYLDLVPSRRPDGSRLNPGRDLDPAAVTLLVPSGTPRDVVAGLRASAVGTWTDTLGLGSVPAWKGGRPVVREVAVAGGTTQYGVVSDELTRIVGPVVIVWPRSFVPGDGFAFTGDGKLLRTADAPAILAASPGLRGGMLRPEPITATLRERLADVRVSRSRDLVELLGYLVVLPLSAVAALLLYTRQHARRIFAQTVSGRPLVELMPLVLVLDAVTVAATSWALRPRTATLSDLNSYGQSAANAPMLQFLAALAVSAALVAGQVALFRVLQRRILLARGGEE